MAWRLRLAPEKTNIDFFRAQWATFGGSIALMLAAFVIWGVMGLNFGIDFKGGTTLRTESSTPIDTGLYRDALHALALGDVAVNEVFDPSSHPISTWPRSAFRRKRAIRSRPRTWRRPRRRCRRWTRN